MTARPHFILALMLAILGLVLSRSLQPRVTRDAVTVVHVTGWTCEYGTPVECRRGWTSVRGMGLRGDRLL